MATAKGTKQLNVGITAELMEELQQFVEERGETLRRVVEGALRRHMDNPPPNVPPPPPVYPPLPPVTPPEPSAPKKGKGKK
jgi:hypothetical protein